ncbi:hypothetical protein [Candidatus Enterococcus leclercqii]|uniref:hypothetical protein n=1 Tax=Candidatus Enterococcus leclercqii TaxID=1857218 RepID=UPI00137A6782|nr:hypothetical protein [Enterococcus sp. CU9D]KAF1291319.1 hypothetical protein BAU14_00300 [Enterococcus sp. CU9D]
MKSVMDNITKWTVNGVTGFYHILIANTYFILSNLLGLLTLLLFQMTINNLVLFVLPLFLLLQSILMQFQIMPELESYSLKRYMKMYPRVLRKNWQVLAIATAAILLIIADIHILTTFQDTQFLIAGLLITSFFLINCILFVLLIQTRKEAEELSLAKKIQSGLLLSYRLPLVTLLNMFYIGIACLSIQFVAVYYVVFIGGFLNLLIWKNLQRRFSLALYFEQITVQNKK